MELFDKKFFGQQIAYFIFSDAGENQCAVLFSNFCGIYTPL